MLEKKRLDFESNSPQQVPGAQRYNEALGSGGCGIYEDSIEAGQRGDFPTAMRVWRPLAEQVGAVVAGSFEAEHYPG